MDELPIIDSPFPGVYANVFRLRYDGFAIEIDWRNLRSAESDATKPAALQTVARVTIPPALAEALVKDLGSLLGQIAARGLDQHPAPSSAM